MNDFLKICANVEHQNAKELCIILGDQSCNLDSVISTISVAFFYQNNPIRFHCNSKTYDAFLPVLNINRLEFAIKTDVIYFLKKHSIGLENLIFLDEIHKIILEKNDIILVNHHISPYFSKVIEVFDHHPFDPTSRLPDNCHKFICDASACATVIADLYFNLINVKLYEQVLHLLYGPIIQQIENSSKNTKEEVKETNDLDEIVIAEIETTLKIENSKLHRQQILDELFKASEDISSLDSYQILSRDTKVIQSGSKLVNVMVASLPILVENYIKMENAEDNVKKYANNKNCCVLVLLGMNVTNENTTKDVGLINLRNVELLNNLFSVIINCEDPYLNLKETKGVRFLNGIFFKQFNVDATKEHLIPIINVILDDM